MYTQSQAAGFVCGYREAGGVDFSEDGHTWDPRNPLNARGVHRHMPPERIDHVLRRAFGPLRGVTASKAQVTNATGMRFCGGC